MKRLVSTTLVLVLLPLAATALASEKARIVTGFEQASKCISKVQVNTIDSENVRVPESGFTVEPGRHSMTGRAVVNNAFCKNLDYSPSNLDVQPLEADFEAGKTYYVGYDHSSENREEWGLVIWKVKD